MRDKSSRFKEALEDFAARYVETINARARILLANDLHLATLLEYVYSPLQHGDPIPHARKQAVDHVLHLLTSPSAPYDKFVMLAAVDLVRSSRVVN